MSVEVHMLPVSAGDATLLICSEGNSRHTVLIDAGLHETEAASYLQSIGVYRLDLIILSHPDLDHLGGLLAILNSKTMSVGTIWCFDLGFLRDFIITGKIPKSRPGTRPVIYELVTRATLDQFSDILKAASGKIRVLQVSEGYRLSLGRMLIEVLYPPESFYDSLRSPNAIRKLLSRRKWPDGWTGRDKEDHEERRKANPITLRDQQERLSRILEKSDTVKPEALLAGTYLESSDTDETNDGDETQDQDTLSWEMVGTLYNNMSIVVKVSALGGITSPTMLFPGDLTDWTNLIFRQWPNLTADLLKMPHHGSKHVTCDIGSIQHYLDCCDYVHRRFLHRRYCPYHFPFDLMFRSRWKGLHRAIQTESPIEVIRNLVRPSRVLVFPHPAHNLPSVDMATLASNVFANRKDRDLSKLNLRQNPPAVALLAIGRENDQISEVRG